VILVESVIQGVVVPLAACHPVLLVVIDGIGMAVFRELQADLMRRGWVEIDSPDESRRLPVIAALPTVTEVSRTSLLCGVLSAGSASDEKAGFAKHPDLLSAGSRSKPPVLYHKADLARDGTAGVAPNVVGAIADDKQRVVGVVINAVDDHLAKGDQIRVDWTVHRIKPLEKLLTAASDAGRAVIVVSDHGHIPENKTVGRGEESAERWREAVGTPNDDEVLLSGPRVVLGQGHKIIVPWSERVRYSAKKNGYHGGASPQEVVIPLGIFTPPGVATKAGRRLLRTFLHGGSQRLRHPSGPWNVPRLRSRSHRQGWENKGGCSPQRKRSLRPRQRPLRAGAGVDRSAHGLRNDGGSAANGLARRPARGAHPCDPGCAR
jgi:hypothetical protein